MKTVYIKPTSAGKFLDPLYIAIYNHPTIIPSVSFSWQATVISFCNVVIALHLRKVPQAIGNPYGHLGCP